MLLQKDLQWQILHTENHRPTQHVGYCSLHDSTVKCVRKQPALRKALDVVLLQLLLLCLGFHRPREVSDRDDEETVECVSIDTAAGNFLHEDIPI